MSAFPFNDSFYQNPARGPLRLRLAAVLGRWAVDGVWRPYSHDLASQGTHLVEAFPPGHGAIIEMLYSPPDWDETVRELVTHRGRLPVSAFPDHDGKLLMLRLDSNRILRLRVLHTDLYTRIDPDRPDLRNRKSRATAAARGGDALLRRQRPSRPSR